MQDCSDIKYKDLTWSHDDHVTCLLYTSKEEFYTDAPYLAGAYIGFFNGAAGGAYVANLLYKLTGEEGYKKFAKTVTDDLIDAGKEENGALTWYGFYGILGEGAFPLFLLEMYQTYQDKRYLTAADQAAKYRCV